MHIVCMNFTSTVHSTAAYMHEPYNYNAFSKTLMRFMVAIHKRLHAL
jgi:hypothetical protein